MPESVTPWISNDAVVLGLLFVILATVFATAQSPSPGWQKFYKYVPTLLLCYFIPSIFASIHIGGRPIISGDHSRLYFVSSRYLLPACLVLLCLSVDLKAILRLGPKALIMFFTGTLGIVLGGPIALWIMMTLQPEAFSATGPDALWRGMTTVAGSWIGGGANQTAMREIFDVGDQIFSAMIAVDVICANVWMAVLLFMAGESDQIDKKTKADNSAIKALQARLEKFHESVKQTPTFTDTIKILAVGFGIAAMAHLFAGWLGPFFNDTLPGMLDGAFGKSQKEISDAMNWLSLTSGFFWLIVLATIGGVALSFTKMRNLEGLGASRVGSVFLYVLIASIGMRMDILSIFRQPTLFLIGFIWIAFHAILLLIVAKLIKAPVFFLAVGSQANVGGAASAPVVASAFHPSLAPVGVLLAVLGYAVGTFGAWLCGIIMQTMAG